MAREAIFIGYRRDDTQDTAGRIYDRLAAAFGERAVFKDVDNLPIGTDFGEYILGLLPRCRVFLALIGPHWLEAKDETGQRRLDDPADWVRLELETAFATPGLQVVPVLVNGARMPRGDELPESLRRLPRLNAAVVRRDPDFNTDMARMVEALRASVRTGVLDLASLGGKAEPARPAPRPARAGNRHGLLFAGGWRRWRSARSATAPGVTWRPARRHKRKLNKRLRSRRAQHAAAQARQTSTKRSGAPRPWAPMPPTRLVYTTCTAMSENGCRIAMRNPIRACRPMVPLTKRIARSACAGAAVGAAQRRFCALPSATGARQRSGTTGWVSVSRGRFNLMHGYMFT